MLWQNRPTVEIITFVFNHSGWCDWKDCLVPPAHRA